MIESIEILAWVMLAYVIIMLIESVAHPPRQSKRERKWMW